MFQSGGDVRLALKRSKEKGDFPEHVMKHFIECRVDESAGLYASASEYIRDLVRRDYEAEEARKWAWLRSELKEGAVADPSEFKPLDAETVIQKGRKLRRAHVR